MERLAGQLRQQVLQLDALGNRGEGATACERPGGAGSLATHGVVALWLEMRISERRSEGFSFCAFRAESCQEL